MRTSLMKRCEQFTANREAIGKAYLLEDDRIIAASAGLFAVDGIEITTEQIKNAKALLKSKTGIFSNFRGEVSTPIHCILAASDDPEALLNDALEAYDVLKQHFFFASYLPIASLFVAQSVPKERYEEIAERTRAIYKQMKQAHPFLTGEEDELMCAMLAMTDKTVEQAIQDCETCYEILNGKFGLFASKNGIQALSHVISMAGGDLENNSERALALFNIFKEADHPFSNQETLGGLGALAILPDNVDKIAQDVLEVSDYLKEQKGYGFLGIDKRQRMLHAAILAAADRSADKTGVAAAIEGTIATIIAEEITFICIISATQASTSHSSGSN